MKDRERLAQVDARRKTVVQRLERSGITQSSIAARLAVPESTVSKVLAGKAACRRGNARKVAVALGIVDGELGVSVDDVLVGLQAA